MKLSELIALAEKANTFGLNPEEVTVEFKSGGNVIAFMDAKACVNVSAEKADPKLTITLTSSNSGYGYR